MDVKLKNAKSPLANNLHFYLPLIEEITEAGMTPMCIIGLKITEGDSASIRAYFATHNEIMDEMLYGICKAFVEAHDAGTLNTV